MTIVTQLVHALEPWKSLYSDSKVVSSIVTGIHLVGLLFGGGLAVAADRATLRALHRPKAERTALLGELHAVHRPVLVAITALFVSGIALAAADLETFLTTPVFYLKLGLVTLLLANGWMLERTERALRRAAPGADAETRLWHRLRTTAWLSLTLWASTVVAGTVLVNAA
jgi:hypothetical protein